MLTHRRFHTLFATSAVAAAGLLTACSVNAADSTTSVSGTDDACTIASDEIAAGTVEFDFTNRAGDVSELYVLRADGDVVGEVENVTTGTTRKLTVDLVAGEYEVRCKPGQTGDGFSSSFVVVGEGGAALATPDRDITFEAVDFTYEDLDLSGITAGTTIRFVMTNDGTQPHEFEVLDPDGEAVGEVAAVDPGETGGATITFETAGTYTFQCILIDPATNKRHSMLGMSGTFDVSDS